MRHQIDQTEEFVFIENLHDYFTDGRYSITKRLFFIFLTANCMLMMVLLNKNMGTKIARQSESIVALIWLVALFEISMHNYRQNIDAGIVDDTISAPLVFLHGAAFVLFSIWRKVGAWWNMRNSGKPGFKKRLDYGIGDSVIYPVIRWILKPLGLIDNERNPKTWLKLNEDRWMQIWQPLILVIVGFQISSMGYEVYGNFLMWATICYFYVTFKAFDNTAKIRQAQTDADLTSDILEPRGQEKDRHIIRNQ